ncbi:hypothetical protein ATN89_17220 [Comamonas thiooxydans]|uniref:hypothetical protein n=1 Tax=Comamonas thiooxydans TaxID=363952 RepID=UPI0007C4FB38|nr:hypothetical protein [Comamonas thiooxydans]OAD82959.1 hypothetical protein ATN89_17220 [Comamonas thiooxydans]
MTAHVLLIDGNSIAHACNSITTMKSGEMETQAIYGFLRSLRVLVGGDRHANDKKVVPYVLWDGRAQWRYDLLESYKGNRVAKTEEEELAKQRFRAQLPYLYAALSTLGIKQFRCPTQEADDLGGHFSRALSAAGVSVTLVSGDRDWTGLVNELVDWYDPIRDKRVDHFSFKEVTGAPGPKAYYQLKALQGDTSDNIAPMKRLGKNAQPFLELWGTMENFYAAVDSGQYQVKKASKGAKNPHYEEYMASPEGRAHFALNMQLMDLSTPQPEGSIPPLSKLVFADNGSGANPEKFIKLCERLGFLSILKKMDDFLGTFGLGNPRTGFSPIPF